MQLAQAPGAKPYEEWLAQLNAAYGLGPGHYPRLLHLAEQGYCRQLRRQLEVERARCARNSTEVIGLSVIMGGISFVLSM